MGKFFPAYLLILGAMLIMVDLTRHLCNDAWGTTCMDRAAGIFPELPKEYDRFCYFNGFAGMYYSDPDGTEHLNTLGYIGTACTWVGFFCLIVGIFWGIDFHRKLRMQWRQIRRTRAASAAARERPLLPTAAAA